ncbi:GATA transcription factor 21-like [Zingiber officinale]|uniref:GATA-type domain-containing protein n=1 Tax=Zingiber officinale TaxID=94328 RepID=A0A8J5FYK1_ZINOF|nr:GATA transcription factor 21-like [Zingiber officinale]KAG6497265.1 hypothetical protein ZIOFF_045163 [Zingiber officinale]
MSSFDLNQASSIEEEEHDLCVPNHLFTALYHRSSDYSCITFDRHQQHEHKEILFMDGSSCNDDRGSIAPDPANESHGNDLKLSLCDPLGSLKREEEEEEEEASVVREGNWVPSKMRFMRKMMKYSAHMIVSKPSDLSQEAIQPVRGFPIRTSSTAAHKNNNNTDSNSTSPSGIIRVCSDCNTTKTPLWRSGPRGPKSLCNACGIRQRKARRAMAAALHGGVGLTGGGGGHATAVVANKARKETKLGIDRTDLPFKKRCKVNITASPPRPPPKKLCFDDAALKASNSTVIKKVFPQEERDAAVLLMALSCGIIRS